MTFKSRDQPLCRCCGKAIKKHTNTVYIGDIANKERERAYAMFDEKVFVSPDQWPRSKADCQKLSNLQVVSVAYQRWSGETLDQSKVSSFTVWDGESYYDEFFCTGDCAKRWGYVMAAAFPGKVSKAYNEALGKVAAKLAKESEVL